MVPVDEGVHFEHVQTIGSDIGTESVVWLKMNAFQDKSKGLYFQTPPYFLKTEDS
jgi:hypothetical protein